MAIPIDTSGPLLFNSDLAKLVAAVVKADPNGEHDWIEWKRRLDLSEKSSQEHIVKHVLGFANRTVQTAALWGSRTWLWALSCGFRLPARTC